MHWHTLLMAKSSLVNKSGPVSIVLDKLIAVDVLFRGRLRSLGLKNFYAIFIIKFRNAF